MKPIPFKILTVKDPTINAQLLEVYRRRKSENRRDSEGFLLTKYKLVEEVLQLGMKHHPEFSLRNQSKKASHEKQG